MIYETPSDAYLGTVQTLIDHPTFRSAPRGQAIREILHYQFSVKTPSSEPLKTRDPQRNVKLEAYTKAEFDLYAKGERLAGEFAKASKFWSKIQNPDGTINSAYGHLIFFDRSCGNPVFEANAGNDPASFKKPEELGRSLFRTPWEWARLALITDKDSRQAILKFHKREHLWLGNKDQVCTLSGSFHIRDDKLHFGIHMRSNDVVKGLSYDLPWFCYLMERMCRELKPTYPNLALGHYTHFVDSMHLYEADLALAQKMLGFPDAELGLS